jgi:hypothetical protein
MVGPIFDFIKAVICAWFDFLYRNCSVGRFQYDIPGWIFSNGDDPFSSDRGERHHTPRPY